MLQRAEHADVAVIGAGAAGIIAAWRAAALGARVVLFEKSPRVGTKILLSGGGKCNITHDGPLEDVLQAFRPNEARFIRSSCYRFPPSEIVKMLTDRGLVVLTRPDGRIFPAHQTAKDVVAILRSYLDEQHVDLRLSTPIEAVAKDEKGVCGVVAGGATLPFRHVVLCAGGSSYPASGTTGDGWPWAKELGHRLVRLRAALAPMDLDPKPQEGYPGVALRDVVLKARQWGKEAERWRGDLLFTHHGVSGPTALGVSRTVTEQLETGEVRLQVDLRPDDSFESVTALLNGEVARSGRRRLETWLDEWMPSKLVPDLVALAGIPCATPLSQLQKKQKNRLIEVLKGWDIGQVRRVVFDKGEVVAGGVRLDEVDPKTMRSQVCPGLYLAGEVLDVAGPVGGYNLQAAWATGYVAGESAALDAVQPST